MRLILALLLALPLLMVAQEDPVLFTVEGNPVHQSEFEYIYNKNNGSSADYSEASLEEYLDLYIKFKLKVQRAKELQLDTIPGLKKELEGYRRQLANSYLTDKEVSERLARELYSRMKEDVEVSHILFSLSKNASPEDVEEARAKAEKIKGFIDEGASFESMAKQYSDDKNSKKNDGKIGFVTAMLPNGFYDLENTIYNLPEGEISEPIRTSVGFHLVKTHGRRPARGKVEAAHILIRKNTQTAPDPQAEARIDSVYKLLERGANFADLARRFSEDKASKNKGGNIGVFGINRFERSFEDAAFSIKREGKYSKPVETKIGWHIIQLVDRVELESYERLKRRLQADIAKDDRYNIAQGSMIDRIKTENGFMKIDSNLNAFSDNLNKDFLTYKWKIPADLEDATIFTLGGVEYGTKDFAKYLRTNSRSRLRMNNNTPIREAVNTLFEEYVKNECIKFEEANLEDKYPDFKALMREYEEGILLFEATKLAVWDKASQDTVGLRAFFNDHRDDYMWERRAEVTTVTVENVDSKKAAKIHKYAGKKSVDKAVSKYNKKDVVISTKKALLEKDQFDKLEGMVFEKGYITEMDYNPDESTASFKMVTDVLQPERKKLNEARGYIIADYQDHLEKEWVASLREAYKVELNDEVFEALQK